MRGNDDQNACKEQSKLPHSKAAHNKVQNFAVQSPDVKLPVAWMSTN